MSKKHIEECVRENLEGYFKDLRGTEPAAMYDMILGVVEKPLIVPAELLCTLCTDDRKDKPKLGMQVIRGAVKTEGKDVWENGKILDPDNGKSYGLRLTPVDGGNKLEVRGSIGPFGRTQTWIRIQ